VTEHNADASETFELGFNDMSDWSEAEYLSLLHHLPQVYQQQTDYEIFDENAPVANAVDWVASGAVNPIKN